MLQYFRINDPYRLLGLLAILLLISLPMLIDPAPLTKPELKSMVIGEKVERGFLPYVAIIDSVAPLTAWFYGVIHFVFGDSLLARHIISLIIILIQAVFLGFIFIDKKVFPESSFLPSLLFCVLFLFSFDMLALSGELMGSFFLLIALNCLYKEVEFREQGNENVFNTGISIGIASLFSFSFIIYLLAALVILILFSRFSGPKIFLTIVGALMPHLLIVSIFFMNAGVGDIWNYFYLPNLRFGGNPLIDFTSVLFLSIVPLTFTIVAVFILIRESRFTKYQSQLLQLMFFWMLFSVIQIAYSKDFRPQSFITLIPSGSFYIAHFILMIRRKKIAELAFLIFIAGVVVISYLARYDVITQVDYDPLLADNANPAIRGKRIVVLSDKENLYRENTLTTPFYNWTLSKPIFDEPEYYENVLRVYHGFIEDPPDLIVDPEKKMHPFFERIPLLKNMYTVGPEGYQKN